MRNGRIALVFASIVLVLLAGCAGYNDYVVNKPIMPGDGIGILTYQQEVEGGLFGIGGKQVYRLQNFTTELSVNATQIFAKEGYPVKVVNLNFFTLTKRYPEVADVLKKLEARATVQFPDLVDLSVAKVTELDYDVQVKHDLERIRQELGLKYLLILTRSGVNPVSYRFVGIDLNEYDYAVVQSFRNNFNPFYGLLKAVDPYYDTRLLRSNLSLFVKTMSAKGSN